VIRIGTAPPPTLSALSMDTASAPLTGLEMRPAGEGVEEVLEGVLVSSLSRGRALSILEVDSIVTPMQVDTILTTLLGTAVPVTIKKRFHNLANVKSYPSKICMW